MEAAPPPQQPEQWDGYAYARLGPEVWSGPAQQAWGPPPWSAAPEVRRAERRRTGTRLGIIAFCMPLVAIPLAFLGFVTFIAGIGLVFLTVAALLWLGCVPIACASLVVLWRSGRRPFWSWLLRCLPPVVVIATVGTTLAIANIEQLAER